MVRVYEVMSTKDYQHSPYGDVPHRAVWETFKTNTTAHGIPHVDNARGPLKKTIWLLLSLASLGGFCYNLYLLGDKFFTYPYKVSVEIKHKTNMTFPAVTVCNNNPVLLSKVMCDESLSEILGLENGTCVTDMPPDTGVEDNLPNEAPAPGPAPVPAPITAPVPAPSPTPKAGSAPAPTTAAASVPAPSPTPKAGPAPAPTTAVGPAAAQTTAAGPVPAPSPTPKAGPAPAPTTAAAPVPAPAPSTAAGPVPAPAPTTAAGPVPAPAPTTAAAPVPAPAPTTAPGPAPGPKGRKKRQIGPAPAPGPAPGPAPVKESDTQNQWYQQNQKREKRADFTTMLKIQTALADMPLDTKVPLGYAIDDLMIDCEFKGGTCNSSDFTTFYNNKFGNCYTFNSGWDKTMNLENSFRPGPLYGLSLIFNVNQTEYVGSLAQSAGMTLVVHPQEKMPFPEDEGVAISPGLHSLIGVNMLSITRIGSPWGNCTAISEFNFTRNVYEEVYGTNYSSNACYKTCYQRNVIEDCGCADARFPNYGEAFGGINHTACDSQNETQEYCTDEVERKYAQGELNCDLTCPEPCIENSFTTTISSQLWPSNNYEEELYSGLRQDNEDVKKLSDPQMVKNIGKFTVYLQEFNYESIEQSELYNEFSFISDVGGILGLYIGFSMLSIMEFFELGIDLLVVSIVSCFRKKQPGGSSTEGQRPNSRTKIAPSDDSGLYMEQDPPPPPYKYHSPSGRNKSDHDSSLTPVEGNSLRLT